MKSLRNLGDGQQGGNTEIQKAGNSETLKLSGDIFTFMGIEKKDRGIDIRSWYEY